MATRTRARLACLGLLAAALCAAGARAQEGWRGLVPLRSTRADVERVLGAPGGGDCRCTYETADEFVRVAYAPGPCRGYPSGWDVPAGTVLRIEVSRKREQTFSELGLDASRYAKAYDDALFTYYASREEGVQYVVSSGGTVRETSYFPAARDARRRCRCFPAEDESIFRTPPYDFFSPRSVEMTLARLDNFAAAAQNDPSMRVYVIVYAGRRAGEAARYRRLVREWLVGRRGVEAGRVSVADGGRRGELAVALFLFPPGMAPPVPQPTLGPCAPRRARGRRTPTRLISRRTFNRVLGSRTRPKSRSPEPK